MPFIACNLPHGIRLDLADGRALTLLGANIGENLQMVSPNGSPSENRSRRYGYGITELTGQQTEAFTMYRNSALYENGDPKGKKLAHPMLAFESGAIVGPFASYAELEAEVSTLAGIVTTGFEGVDPDKAMEKLGVQTDPESSVKPKK